LEQNGSWYDFAIDFTISGGRISGAVSDQFGGAVLSGTYSPSNENISFDKHYTSGMSSGNTFHYDSVYNQGDQKATGQWYQPNVYGVRGAFWMLNQNAPKITTNSPSNIPKTDDDVHGTPQEDARWIDQRFFHDYGSWPEGLTAEVKDYRGGEALYKRMHAMDYENHVFPEYKYGPYDHFRENSNYGDTCEWCQFAVQLDGALNNLVCLAQIVLARRNDGTIDNSVEVYRSNNNNRCHTRRSDSRFLGFKIRKDHSPLNFTRISGADINYVRNTRQVLGITTRQCPYCHKDSELFSNDETHTGLCLACKHMFKGQ
jgi:hypothetical protein